MALDEQVVQLLTPIRWPLTGVYLATLSVLCMYGVHRYYLTWVYYRTRLRGRRPARRFEDLPPVTVQLPMFNERHVAERIIEAACRLEYPRDKLQIQVLDDSTDESAAIARHVAERKAAEGFNVEYLHRTDRTGFKAGALEAGLASATGALIAVFDADFIPPPGFLKRTVHHFTDPKVGMVQGCWDHLNRDLSLLTRCQAVFLDSHFLIEHPARNRSGRFMNFNGTAGIWRRETIDAAGGWQHDTLTEDVDLSYRAQMAGWDFVYLPRLQCPAELPPEIHAYKSQQHRWTKGGMQCALKLLPQLFGSAAPMRVKLEGFFHLTSPLAYVCMVVLMILFFPAFFVNVAPLDPHSLEGFIWGVGLFMLTSLSAATFFVASQQSRKRSVWRAVGEVPMLMALGLGMAISNSRAVVEALVGHESPFVRTPKYNANGTDTTWQKTAGLVRLPAKRVVTCIELAMAVYLSGCTAVAVAAHEPNALISVPFLLIFAGGYWYVGLSSVGDEAAFWRRLKPSPALDAAEPSR